jgi:uncharacterized protein YmfQ (DUF2313 family)
MPRLFAALLAAVLVTPATAQDKTDAKEEGWVPLFNGKDLTGWKMVDPPSGQFQKGLKEVKNADGKVTAFVATTKKNDRDPATSEKEFTLWQVKDGTIVGGGPASHLFTEVEAEDFVYRVEAKINDKGNSGQYFRTKLEGGFPAGYEAQINATHTDWRRTGSLYSDARLFPGLKGKEFDEKKKEYDEKLCRKEAGHKADEFFVQEVTAVGDEITITVNGKVTLDKWKDPNKTYTKGHFALQGHDPGSVMTFKKVEYKPLKK